ncbi:MAG: hypothetical protein P9L99_08695 [Candidatus Lernaella stagnicola]|nr:hypothetical protein [Candidatus Lernaella stagnicola]
MNTFTLHTRAASSACRLCVIAPLLLLALLLITAHGAAAEKPPEKEGGALYVANLLYGAETIYVACGDDTFSLAPGKTGRCPRPADDEIRLGTTPTSLGPLQVATEGNFIVELSGPPADYVLQGAVEQLRGLTPSRQSVFVYVWHLGEQP